jgi:hypothetical protein
MKTIDFNVLVMLHGAVMQRFVAVTVRHLGR